MSTILDEFKIIIGIDGKDAKKGMSDVTNSVKGGMKEIKASVETGLASVSKIFSGFGYFFKSIISIIFITFYFQTKSNIFIHA